MKLKNLAQLIVREVQKGNNSVMFQQDVAAVLALLEEHAQPKTEPGGLTTNLRQTHTFVELNVSPLAFGEIKSDLEDADYQHAFIAPDLIDMSGIAIRRVERSSAKQGRLGIG